MEFVVITSENLITNQKLRDGIGYGADSTKEALAIIQEGLKKIDSKPKPAKSVNMQYIFMHK